MFYTSTRSTFWQKIKVINSPSPFPATLTYCYCSTTFVCSIVTSLVTCFNEFKRFNNSIRASWKQVFHPALKLEIIATCKYDCKDGRIYLVHKTVLASNETSFTFTDLEPGSQCEFTLKAVYNPASIDKGINVTYMVLPASKKSSHIHV